MKLLHKPIRAVVQRQSSLIMALLVAFVSLMQPVMAKEPGDPGILWSVDWSPDGKLFAVSGEWVGIFDARTYERRRYPSLDGAKKGNKVQWHPLRNLLAVSGGADDVTAIYDVAADRKILLPTKEGTRGIAWNSTGELLATAGNDGSLQIWSETGKLLHTTKQDKAKGMTGVAWHPTENKVVMVGEFIMLHDGAGKLIKQMRHRPEAKGFCLLLCVEWHPSGEFFAIGDYGNHDTGDLPVIQFWSADCKLLKTINVSENIDGPVRNIGWNREGTLLASASDALRIWSKDGELRHVGKSPDHLWGVRWNRAGDQLLTSSIEGRVTLWTDKAEVSKKIIEASANKSGAEKVGAANGSEATR